MRGIPNNPWGDIATSLQKIGCKLPQTAKLRGFLQAAIEHPHEFEPIVDAAIKKYPPTAATPVPPVAAINEGTHVPAA